LCSDILLLRQHTVHYRAHLHLVIAATAMCLFRCPARGEQAVGVVQRHLQCAEDSAAERGTVLMARLFRALLLQNLLKESHATASKRAAAGALRQELDRLVGLLQALCRCRRPQGAGRCVTAPSSVSSWAAWRWRATTTRRQSSS
jgi:hypothetical protein